MKNLLTVILSVLAFNSQAQIWFHDKAEVLPIVNYTTYPNVYMGYWFYTGGTQNTGAQSPDNNVMLSTAYPMQGKTSYRHYVKYLGQPGNDGQWGRGEWGMVTPDEQRDSTKAWYWTAISITIDPNHAFESRRYQIAFDHKENPDDMETPFYLAILNQRYVLYGRFVDDPYVDLGPVEVGKKVDWALNRNWRTDNSGFMKFYKNGQLVWQRLNQPNRDSRSGSAFFCRVQHGFYKWAWYSGNPEGAGSGNTKGDLIMYSDNIIFAGRNTTIADITAAMAGGTTPPPVDVAPTVSAGPDFYVPFGVAGVLRGSVTGASTSKKWTGPSTATYSTPNADQTNITTTVDGKFASKLSAANGSANASDEAIVYVVKANAGPDQTIDSGKVVQLTGSSTAGIDITNAAWSRVSGNGGTLSGSTVTGLPPGVHVFRYSVVYPSTLSVNDDVQITVKSVAPAVKSRVRVEVGKDFLVTIFFSDGTSITY